MDEERKKKHGSLSEYKLLESYCWSFTGPEVSSKKVHENEEFVPR